MLNIKVGDRVRFKGFTQPDPYSDLKPGTKGTVELILLEYPNMPVHVKWDNGSRLGHFWNEVKLLKGGE